MVVAEEIIVIFCSLLLRHLDMTLGCIIKII